MEKESYTSQFKKKYNDSRVGHEGLIKIADKKVNKPSNDLKLCSEKTLQEVKEIVG